MVHFQPVSFPPNGTIYSPFTKWYIFYIILSMRMGDASPSKQIFDIFEVMNTWLSLEHH
jgi:hypothetical protein